MSYSVNKKARRANISRIDMPLVIDRPIVIPSRRSENGVLLRLFMESRDHIHDRRNYHHPFMIAVETLLLIEERIQSQNIELELACIIRSAVPLPRNRSLVPL